MLGKNTQVRTIWSNAPLILTTARMGSLSLAAKNLSIDRTTLRRRLLKCEEIVGARLFYSDNGQMRLTVEGARIVEQLEKAESFIDDISPNLGTSRDSLGGRVHLSFPPHIRHILLPIITQILLERPDIQFELESSYELSDMAVRESDIAIRLSINEPESPLVAHLICPLHGAYYKGKNVDLDKAVYICNEFETQITEEAVKAFGERQWLRCYDYLTQFDLIERIGIGRTLHEFAKHIPTLEQVTDQLYSRGWSMWLVNHERTRHIPRIKWVSERLINELKKSFS